jgi:hypothetical protein
MISSSLTLLGDIGRMPLLCESSQKFKHFHGQFPSLRLLTTAAFQPAVGSSNEWHCRIVCEIDEI